MARVVNRKQTLHTHLMTQTKQWVNVSGLIAKGRDKGIQAMWQIIKQLIEGWKKGTTQIGLRKLTHLAKASCKEKIRNLSKSQVESQ